MQIDAVHYNPMPPAYETGLKREEVAGEVKQVEESSQGDEAQLDMEKENAGKRPSQQVDDFQQDPYRQSSMVDIIV